MECPNCGKTTGIGFHEFGFADMTGYQCQHCGFKWIQPGIPQPIKEMQEEAREFFMSFRTYSLHGLVIWAIMSVIHFCVAVHSPFISLGSLSATGLLYLSLLIAITGIALGASLLQTLEISGRFWPYPRAIQHTILPLLAAASVGILYGVVFEFLARESSALSILIRHAGVNYFMGVVLAMLSTPVIIVRSSASLRRKGLRPEIRSTENDSRWR